MEQTLRHVLDGECGIHSEIWKDLKALEALLQSEAGRHLDEREQRTLVVKKHYLKRRSDLLAAPSSLPIIKTERMDLGVDRVCLHAYLPKTKFKKEELGKIFPRPKERSQKRPYLVGQRHHNEAGSECRFELSRFPFRSGHDLKIAFNPNTLVQGHNTQIGDAYVFFNSLDEVQRVLWGLGLPLCVGNLSLLELHLTRDITFHCTLGGDDFDSEMKEEEQVLQDVFEYLSWQVPPYARQVKAYNNSQKKTIEDELLEEGLAGGSKSQEWVIYDKITECQQSCVECQPRYGRILRVEWKLKKKKQIQKHLGVATPSQLGAILPPHRVVLEHLFDQHLRAAHFRTFKPYRQRMPRIPSELLTALEGSFTTTAQQTLFERLQQNNRIGRQDVDLFVQVLSQVGAHKVRSRVRDLYGIEAGASKSKRKQYDDCCEMIARLRQHSAWDYWNSYSQIQNQVLHWLCLPRCDE